MLAVLSPAKSLDCSAVPSNLSTTTPALMKDATTLMATTHGLSQKKIRELMDLSPELAKLNYDRFHRFELPFDDRNALPAALMFDGDVYKGLDARSLKPDELAFAQEHVGILSGLFGLLRPLDLIQPYRLEMGTRLKTRRGANLYAFWGDRIAKEIRRSLEGHREPTLVNLASNEYFRAVQTRSLEGSLVTCVFEDWKTHPDDGTVISFMAKRARGLMARFIATSRIDEASGLKDFDVERYRFQPSRSSGDRWVFSRKFVSAAA